MSAIVSRVVQRFRKQAGGSDFSVFVKGTDARRAFEEAVKEARYESGHGGYSGTIAEKSGYKIRKSTPMSMEVAGDFVDSDLEHNDKWGPAFAVPVCEAKKGKPEKVTVEVEADKESRYYDGSYAKNDAIKKIKEDYRRTQPGKTFTFKGLDASQVQAGKAKLTKSPVNRESIFWWKRSKGRESGTEYKSKQEAIERFKANDPRVFLDGEVWTLMEKSPVTSFTVAGGVSSKWSVTVEVTPEDTTGPIIGWYFYGIASS
jgi:hypothetical protein